MHDQNLYQILYALTIITGEKKFAEEADKTLLFFFKNCRCAAMDKVYLSLKHDLTPDGIGFVAGADIHTLVAFTKGYWTHTQPWATGYGKVTDAQVANLCYQRYEQMADGREKQGYRNLIRQCSLDCNEIVEVYYESLLHDDYYGCRIACLYTYAIKSCRAGD